MLRLFLAGLALTACRGNIVDPAANALITTDQSDYIATRTSPGSSLYQLTAITHFHNLSSAPILLTTCVASKPFVGFQPAEPNGTPVGPADSMVNGACSGNDAIVVAPGAVRTDTVVMEPAPTGIGRLFFIAGACPRDPVKIGTDVLGCQTPLPDAQRTSNLITVSLAP